MMKFLRHLSWHPLSIEPLLWGMSKHRLHITSLVMRSQSFLLCKRDSVAHRISGRMFTVGLWDRKEDVKLQSEISLKEELVLRMLNKQRFPLWESHVHNFPLKESANVQVTERKPHHCQQMGWINSALTLRNFSHSEPVSANTMLKTPGSRTAAVS